MTKTHSPSRKTLKQRVEHLTPGMELAQDVMSADRQILAGKGTVISNHTITKLLKWNIATVHTLSEIPVNLVETPLAQQFVRQYLASVDSVRSAFDLIAQQQSPAGHLFADTTEKLTDSLTLAGNVVDLLYSVPEAHTDFYHHSVNVSVISALLASWLDFPADSVSAISLAGLLHDVGKTRLDPSDWHPSTTASDESHRHYENHCRIGFELVKAMPDIGESIARAVLEHHERNDGSGFPLHLHGKRIHTYAQIIALADLYDQTVSIQKDQDVFFSPYAGLEKIWDEISRLNPRNCVVFRENMNNFLSGHRVALTDGRPARVVHLAKDTPSRSIVQLDNDQVIDLMDAEELCIHHVLR